MKFTFRELYFAILGLLTGIALCALIIDQYAVYSLLKKEFFSALAAFGSIFAASSGIWVAITGWKKQEKEKLEEHLRSEYKKALKSANVLHALARRVLLLSDSKSTCFQTPNWRSKTIEDSLLNVVEHIEWRIYDLNYQ
ncbi:hypothetical protein [Marinomonas mediterranea]|jgi:hypothetical protein|uniref:Uncharacterized protein n=1 Tax=Marinomonas mediterranea (strain ATCC 700492 / JCM 21426 / NBRC 103028 / MMB-1) TaxID=717774 RepID=F2JUJ8_MARM1|nr:hypothetical protein [Marinomonas mediterranea]ADZ89331.1 hypothetical protein Marme_0025 [Marinomonas mediterranea MMB-1]WCN07434.1 hypothetical protein GV055_00130 [Marinomonas mediterranea]WCN11530.1 hypothetical protein GV054_00135 [Marinomonas mediterranea]